MSVPLFVVDAFASRAFSGNPAAVCLFDHEREPEWMQLVAREMNLSETAFVVARADGEFGLRWFTPVAEVKLCGHATLASAHVLFETARVERSRTIRFHTQSGVLTATPDAGSIALDFPSCTTEAAPAPEGLLAALGCASPAWMGRSRGDVLLELASEAAVRALAPDFAALGRVDARAFIVTARAASGAPYDFVSRFFAPRMGIAEDPANGASHTSLGAYWSPKLEKRAMTGCQASVRGGIVRVRLAGDRTLLVGDAVTVSRGELLA